jgi:DNA polymerase-1
MGAVSTALIVDGQNVLMRSIFAAKHSHMSSGDVDTGPLLIFINSLAKHIQQEQPTRMIVAWDGGTNPNRIALVPSYKASRKPVPDDEAEHRDTTHDLATRFLALAGVYQLQLPRVEADDIIGAAWGALTPELADKIVVLSSDKDFLQLVGLNPHDVETELVRLSSAGTPTDRWTQGRMMEERGYHPAYWPLVTALAGDPGDGVPGLPRVGPKTAVKRLERAGWDWNKILDDLDHEDEAEGTTLGSIARACRAVVDLRDMHLPMPIQVPPFRPPVPGSLTWSLMIDFLSGLELKSVKARLQAGTLWSDRDLINVTDRENSGNDRV